MFFPEGTHIIFIPSLLAGISHIAPPKTPGGAGIHSLSYVQGGEETGNYQWALVKSTSKYIVLF